MHHYPSHGKYTVWKLDVAELSWIPTPYCPQHIAIFALVKPSELDLIKDTVEDRYFRRR